MIDPAYSVAGAMAGLLIGITGVGGGALMTPVLLMFFGVPPVTAVATDLWFAAITKLAGVRIHHSSGQVDWQVARRLWMGSLPIALMVVLAITMGMHVVKSAWLTQAIGGIVLVTAFGMLFSPQLLALARRQRLDKPLEFKALQPGLTVAAGAGLGLCVALTSVGAGALGSVILRYLYPLRMTPHRLVATDLVHAIPLAIVAGSGYLLAGLVDGAMLLSLLAGSIPAVLIGSLLTKKTSGRTMQLALACVLIAAGVKTML